MLGEIISSVIHDFLILFGIVNIIGNIPHISIITSNVQKSEKIRIFYLASMISLILVLAFAIGGNFILINVFDITFSSFKVAGGIIVFIVAIRGVILGPFCAIGSTKDSDSNHKLFSIIFPFLVGPGTMVTTILLMQASGKSQTVMVVFLVYFFVMLVLLIIPYIEKLFGQLMMMMVSRILYIFIAAKAIKFIISGIKECF